MSTTDVLTAAPERDGTIQGVTVGVVTSIDDPDRLGRVKVKLTNSTTDHRETDFIRVCTPMSGKKWGFFFFPEVGDEVLVAFDDSDTRQPYVIGFLWSKDNPPPVEMKDGQNRIRTIKTKNGHELIFHDENDKNAIEINTPDKRSIKIDDERQLTLITDKDNRNLLKIDSLNDIITLTAASKLILNAGNANITLDGLSNSITINTPQSVTIRSSQITADAKGTMDLKSSNMLNVTASGPTTIKGAVVKLN